MNVLFVMQDTGFAYGAQRATMDLLRGLKADGRVGVQVLLISETRLRRSESTVRDELTETGIPFTSVKVGGAFSMRLVRGIRRAVMSTSSQVIHTVGYKANVHGGIACGWGRRVPQVATVHGWLFRSDLKERLYEWIDLLALRHCTRVVVLSRYYEEILKEGGVAPSQLVRIPSGLDPAGLPAHEQADASLQGGGVLTVGMLGRLSDEKDPLLLLSAMRMLKNEGLRIRALYAGEGALKDALRARAAGEGLTDAVDMPGYMTAPDFFGRVNALVMCSRVENFPYSILEAMAWRRPVVATRVGGIPELVDDRKTGLLFSPGCADELAACLKKLAQRPEFVPMLGAAGREKLEREFPLSATTHHHVDLYAALVG